MTESDKIILVMIILVTLVAATLLYIKLHNEWVSGRWTQKELDEMTKERLEFYSR